MIKKYKSYREQGLECDKNGNRILISAPYSQQSILVCVKYKTYCHSGACAKERGLFEEQKRLKKQK